MPTLRSREIIFKPLEIESILTPSTPLKSDAISAPTRSPSFGASSGGATAPLRRSGRLAAIRGGRSEPRISESPSDGEVRVLEESRRTNLRSAYRITKRRATEEIMVSDDDCFEKDGGEEMARVLKESASMNLRSGTTIGSRKERGFGIGLRESLDFADGFHMVKNGELTEEEIVGLKGKGKLDLDVDRVEKADDEMVIDEEVHAKVVEDDCLLMNLRSGTRFLKKEIKMENGKDSERSVVEEKSMIVENIEVMKSSEGRGILEEETLGSKRLNYEGKGKLVSDADCVEKVRDGMIVDEEGNERGTLVVESCLLMNLRLGTRILKREGKLGNESLYFEGVVVEEEPKIVENGEIIKSSKEKGTLEEEILGMDRLSSEAKGKGKLVLDDDFVENAQDEMVIENEEKEKGNMAVEDHSLVVEDHSLVNCDEVVPEGSSKRRRGRKTRIRMTTESRKEAERNKAIELAPKYAFFKAEDEGSEEEEQEQEELNEEDWPGPFSTAMKIIRDREQMLMSRELNPSSKKVEDTGVKIQWIPLNDRKSRPPGKMVPSLLDLCVKVLCENAEEIESLDGVPDVIKHRLVSHLCRARKMGSRFLGLLAHGSPTEIYLSDCSWVREGEFERALGRCNTENLKVVELGLSGRCLPDYVLQGILARSPNSLPLLTKISLKGNYRLSDVGLKAIVDSAPLLSSINLGQCSLITSSGIITLAHKLESVLRELYIDDCQDVNAMVVLPALMNLKHLEVLSVSGIETVTDKFVKKLVSVCGSTLKEFIFAGCRKLTAASMKVIGESCPQLCSLDLCNLTRLNDSAIGHLANGCRSIQKLKLRRNAFSDEAVAAFVEASGGSLYELSLNNIEKVGQLTAIAISCRCFSNLRSLDLSFCRHMTNEALGLIVDSCSKLRILKIFGCTQINNVFLDGHSNSVVKIVGLKGSILDQIEAPAFV